ncbi:aminopeptidase N-like [Anopheles moucheti]|uniref:aminopeptidase N-like n=1 Tax=Anopheles moucheti TaxID=186751 RepID=UPI0022EFE5BA|nr:aminopeptidase N-like [Anopheles moucheti]
MGLMRNDDDGTGSSSYRLPAVSEPLSYDLYLDLTDNSFASYTGMVDITIKYLATTFFAATYARTVFPCYDEPSYKAKFNIKIRHLSYHTALSNMPVTVSTRFDGYSETTFDTTPLMSTYLVVLVVSEMKTLSSDKELFRVFAPENKINYTIYAHDFAVRAVRALETHFGRQNQMSKIDLVGIPDFAMGAMENWGLITFREDYLIYEGEKETTAYAKQRIASVVTHELVHMWFGNEVTPEWWTYVWLNEGFANYFEYYITSQLEPAWKFWDQFIVSNVHSALSKDCHSSARPMNYYATDPAILNELYDYVVYAKSASVIRMIQNVIGLETFKQAINDYLRSQSYLTTKPEYLYASIEKFRTVDLPASVEAIFESWANAPGYPVVTVTVDRTKRTLTASQKRFWMPNEVDTPPENKLFYIPLNYASNVPSSNDFQDTAPTFWLTPADPSTTISLETNVEWLVVNKQQTGYYRVNYDVESWHKLIEVLNSDRFEELLPVINRAQLVDDVANLARAGQVGYDVALSLIRYLERETEYVPWSTAYDALLHLDRMFSSNEEYMRFESYGRTITSHVFNVTNLAEGTHLDRLHRDKSIYLACYFGVPACLNMATSIVKAALDEETLDVPKEIQSAVFCALHKHDLPIEGDYGIELFQKFWQATDQYKHLMNMFIGSLGCSRNPALTEFFLQMIEIDTPALPVTSAMKSNILTSMIAGSPITRNAAFQYIRSRFAVVSDMLDRQLVPIFNAFGTSINTPAEYNMLKELVQSYQVSLVPASLEAANRALVQAEQNLNWIDKHKVAVAKWLTEENFEGGIPDDNGAEVASPSVGIFAAVGIISISLWRIQ